MNFLFFHLKSNYVIRIGTRQDRYVSMPEFSNHAVLLMSDSTMAVRHQNTHKTFPYKSFSLRFLVNGFSVSTSGLYFGAIFLTCSLLCMSLRQLTRVHYLKLASSVCALLKPYGDTLNCT